MLSSKPSKLDEAAEVLQALGFSGKATNTMATATLLALLKLQETDSWNSAQNPLMGITPIIAFISKNYAIAYQPNTRESVRDDAVKTFLEAGLLTKNPDKPDRPTNSGKTVYQIEPLALTTIRAYGSKQWTKRLSEYLTSKEDILAELSRKRKLALVPVKLPSGETVVLSPGGQNPLIKQIVELFCPRFVKNPELLYLGDTAGKFIHYSKDYLERLGIIIPNEAKIPDVIVHDKEKNWLLLIEAVSSGGHVDANRRRQLKSLFRNSKAGLVFVSAFPSFREMRQFLPYISWETEVWVAQDPDHMIHFNGERFLGPYPDVSPQ